MAFRKFNHNKAFIIDLPKAGRQAMKPRSLQEIFSDIPAADIVVADHIPEDEKSGTRYRLKMLVFPLQRWMYRRLPPMQHDVFSIHENPHKALDNAYRGARRRRYDPPELPPEFEGSPDLGSLAVRGPYACYLQRITNDKDEKHAGDYEWDLSDLKKYKVHPHLYNLGTRVLFRLVPIPALPQHDPLSVMPARHKLQAYQIESALGTSTPQDANWQLAKKLALCALSNHMSLVRHWNWVHLTPTAHLAMATRNHLPPHHPIRRLLWPHVFGTQQSNYFGTMAQMVPNGDFAEIFSFTHEEMCKLFNETYKTYPFSITDPHEDASDRGIINAGFEIPTQRNLEDLFNVIHAHTWRFVSLSYADDRAILNDPHLLHWFENLNALIPGKGEDKIGVSSANVTRGLLSKLVARFIYVVSAYHEMVGSFLWNYQLWTHRQRVRMYDDGRREPLDVYQRLVNYNFMLNVKRTPLMQDFSELASGLEKQESAAHCFRQFKKDLESLQTKMDSEPWAVWKIYPKDLEAHINA